MNSATVRWVSIDSAYASWLSTLTMHDTDACIFVCLKIHTASLRSGPTMVVEMMLTLLVQLSSAEFSNLVAMCSSCTMVGAKT